MRLLQALIVLFCLIAAPLRAETPWEAAEFLRSETGRLERLFLMPASPQRMIEANTRLAEMREIWTQTAPAFGAQGKAAETALAGLADSVAREDAQGVARGRQLIWTGLMQGARDHALAALEAGDAETAAGWLNIRDYARASGDTRAVMAVEALRAGQISPEAARQTVEDELLIVAASELRLALARAADDAAGGRMVQYASDLGRIEGMVSYLGANLAERLGPQEHAALAADLALAAGDPAALAAVQARLATYAPVALTPEETLRRARLLRRFTALVWEEYRDGIRDGVIRSSMEYNEALLFRDRAAMILGDLAPEIADRAAADRLGTLMAEMAQIMAAREDGIEPRVTEALGVIDRLFGEEVASGGYAAAVDALPAALDELVLMVGQGDWEGAELKRLEAYSWFDPDIEQRLVPRAPAMALRLEARFWEGRADRPGLGRLVADHAPEDAFLAEVEGIKTDLNGAREKIEAPISRLGAMLQSSAILFREGLEAVLILAALMAALRAEGVDPARFRRPLAVGVVAALAGSFALWAGARWLFSISTLAREALEGGTALVAAVVLVWMVMGLSAQGGQVSALRRKLAGSVTPGSVAMLAFLVVFREGFETVLFYEALLVDAPAMPVMLGLALGLAGVIAAGWLVLVSGRRLPLALFFRATSVLLSLLAIMLVGAGIRGLQTAALIGATPVGWFPDRDWLQLWFGLFPVAEPLAAQALVVVVLLVTFAVNGYNKRSRTTVAAGQLWQ
ncbi:FTR1 family iron permease [Paracoccus sp. (in: a-proteobacteria)]|uniref:FTR1 family iron permease n=1 Tax=Paracoccus sp. TaxID=267 RepID=UPI002AFE2042|nr:FTR1 family protein [Paracoccus sp. (in: a-proteobacteria)]